MTRRRMQVRFTRPGARHRRGGGGAISVVARTATIAVVVAGAVQLAGPAAADDTPSNPTVVEAADDYSANSPESAAALVEAASPTDSVPIADHGGIADADGAGGTTVAVDRSGGATLTAPGMPAVKIAVPGASNTDAVVSDGAVVNSDALPSTDVVTRATDTGGQIVAVLESAAASESIPFTLNLPAGSSLVPRADGSIEVNAPVESEVVPQAELDRVASQVEKALGDTSSDAPLTDAELAAIRAIAPVETQTASQVETIATVAPAWAVDASGTNLQTHYEVDGDTITQVVETSSSTAYPVTADPSWVRWAWTTATCVSDVAALILGAQYVLASKITKIQKYLTSNRRAMALVEKFGGVKNTLTAVWNAGKGLVKGSIYKYLSGGQVAALSGLVAVGLNEIADLAGIGACFSLIREAT